MEDTASDACYRVEIFIVGQGGVNKIGPPLGDTALSAPVGQYSSSTNRAQYSLTPSSESGSVKRAQQRQKSLAEADLEEKI